MATSKNSGVGIGALGKTDATKEEITKIKAMPSLQGVIASGHNKTKFEQLDTGLFDKKPGDFS